MTAFRLHKYLFRRPIIQLFDAFSGARKIVLSNSGEVFDSTAPVMQKSHFSLSNSIWGAPHLSTILYALSMIVARYFVALKGYFTCRQDSIRNLSYFKTELE